MPMSVLKYEPCPCPPKNIMLPRTMLAACSYNPPLYTGTGTPEVTLDHLWVGMSYAQTSEKASKPPPIPPNMYMMSPLTRAVWPYRSEPSGRQTAHLLALHTPVLKSYTLTSLIGAPLVSLYPPKTYILPSCTTAVCPYTPLRVELVTLSSTTTCLRLRSVHSPLSNEYFQRSAYRVLRLVARPPNMYMSPMYSTRLMSERGAGMRSSKEAGVVYFQMFSSNEYSQMSLKPYPERSPPNTHIEPPCTTALWP
mmetsp:Transcript_64749/g.204443  ORF Transcript_64749/g.204443 Transcript_64749/m.204443 type:complete len:252 (-) Transcript_64749:5494-6249(-)